MPSKKPLKKWWGVNPNIFRAYDIRGLYPEELNAKTAYLIGRALVKFLNKPKADIVVGRDNRLSSPTLFKNLVQGIIDEGADVIDIGLSTSPMLYWAVADYKFDGGVEITSSHNPPQWNGFKLVKEKAVFISEKTGLKKIKKIVQEMSGAEEKKNKAPKGKIQKKKVLNNYLKFILKDFKKEKISDLKIVIDTGNAVPGILIPEISQKVPFKIYHLFSKLNGNFPNRSLYPLEKGSLKALQKEVKLRKADLGVAFDGDGDRIIFVDEKSRIIASDLILALMAKIILEKNPGQKILYTICSSNIIKEVIKEKGGLPIINRVGHAFIKERMKKEGIFFAGEFSGHYYSKTHYFNEAPFFVLFKVLEEISKTKKTLSQVLKPYQKYFHSGEIIFKVVSPKKILKKIEKKYKKGKISHLDGLRVDFKDWWFNIRPSQTEPILKLVVEGKTKKIMEEKIKELSSLVT